jgi:hypothetical protein
MRAVYKRVWVFLVALSLLAPPPAAADTSSVGIQLGTTHATHRETGGSATAPAIPVPILTASTRSGCLEFSAEGFPPVGPVSFGNNGLGLKDITLSYADAGATYWNPSHTIALGVGETLYNQRTDFLEQVAPGDQRTLVDRSRVAGARYELTLRKPLRTNDYAQIRFAVNPAMHGRFTQMEVPLAAPGRIVAIGPVWEHASQVDADARVTHEFGAYAISYGVRYLNYNASFDSWLSPQFADANAIVMPYLALVRTFGQAPNAANTDTHACARPRVPIVVRGFVGGELFTGAHQDSYGAVRDTAVASIPLYALRGRYRQYELLLEDVPVPGPISGKPVPFSGSAYTVKAGYGAGVLRYWLRAGGTGFGVGDSLYVSQQHVSHHERIAERAAGLRYEVLQRVALVGGTQMQVALAISPSMHQRSTFWFDDFRGAGFSPSFGVGSLVDASLQFETDHGPRHSWVYGLRYINYAGGAYRRYDRMKDRTGVIGAFAAWGLPLSR